MLTLDQTKARAGMAKAREEALKRVNAAYDALRVAVFSEDQVDRPGAPVRLVDEERGNSRRTWP